MSCLFKPTKDCHIGKKSDEISPLYADLEFAFSGDRNAALSVYKKIISLDTSKIDNVQFYEGTKEPKILSIIKNIDIDEKNVSLMDGLKRLVLRSMGQYDSNGNKKTYTGKENYLNIKNKIVSFNTRSQFSDMFHAQSETNDDGSYEINLINYSSESAKHIMDETVREVKNQELGERLRKRLAEWGIKVSYLDELESRVSNGVTDFDSAQKTAEGIVNLIRVAKNKAGIAALPEEFAHFVLRVMSDTPIVQRLTSFVKDNELYKEILGFEFEKYKEVYNGDVDTLVEEALGKLVSQYIINKYGDDSTGDLNSILSRVEKSFKQKFSQYNEGEILNIIDGVMREINDFVDTALFESDIKINLDVVKKKSKKLHQLNNDIVSATNSLSRVISEEILPAERRHVVKLKYQTDSDEELDALNTLLDEMNRNEDTLGQIKSWCNYITNELCGTLNTELNYKWENTGNAPHIQIERNGVKNQTALRVNGFDNSDITAFIVDGVKVSIPRWTRFNNMIQYLITHLDEVKSIEISEDKIKFTVQAGTDKLQTTTIFKNYRSYGGRQDQFTVERISESTISRTEGLLDKLKDISNSDLKDQARLLRDITAKKRCYCSIIGSISAILRAKCGLVDIYKPRDSYNEEEKKIYDLLELLARFNNEVSMIDNDIKCNIKRVFIDWIRKFIPKDGIYDPKEGKYITAEDIAKEAQKDISFWERWMCSMAESGDMVLQIFDQQNVEAKHSSRIRSLEYATKILALGKEYEQKGIKDTDWMYERDDLGNLTGNFIAKYSSQYNDLSETQKEMYNKFMNIYHALQSYIPKFYYENIYQAPITHRDFIDKLKTGGLIKTIKEELRDAFTKNLYDTEAGEIIKNVDINNEVYESIPVFYLFRNMQDSSLVQEMSTDAISSLIMFADMAMNYDEMNKVVDVMELARDYMVEGNRPIPEKKGNKDVVSKIYHLGQEYVEKIYKPKGSSNIVDRLNDFMRMQVYGRYMNDEIFSMFGSDINAGKVTDVLIRLTALNTMSLNLLAGISNIATGKVMMKEEAIAKQFFNMKDVHTADKIYLKEITGVLGELGQRIKTNKLNLWTQYFDVYQEAERDRKEHKWNRDTLFKRFLGTNSLFFMMNGGEHWMQARTSLAVAQTIKLKDAQGNEYTLWEAYEPKYIDENDHSKGAILGLKEGLVKEDGTPFTMKDVNKFINKVNDINHRLHGIYNNDDKCALQAFALGRLAFLFRKWIVPSVNRRWGRRYYNLNTESWYEGYYYPMFKFMKTLASDMRHLQFNFVTRFNELSDEDKENVRRALTEVGYFVALSIICAALGSGSKLKDRSWILRFLGYQAYRLKAEIGAFVPGPCLTELFTIVKNPSACLDTAQDIYSMICTFINPMNWETFGGEDALVKSGRYEGLSRGQRAFITSPFFPWSGQIYNAINPEEPTKIFSNQ